MLSHLFVLEITSSNVSHLLNYLVLKSETILNGMTTHIYCKAANHLYTLRVLKGAGLAYSNIENSYKCSVRSVLEYAVAAWQDIPEYLSSKLESMERSAPIR